MTKIELDTIAKRSGGVIDWWNFDRLRSISDSRDLAKRLADDVMALVEKVRELESALSTAHEIFAVECDKMKQLTKEIHSIPINLPQLRWSEWDNLFIGKVPFGRVYQKRNDKWAVVIGFENEIVTEHETKQEAMAFVEQAATQALGFVA